MANQQNLSFSYQLYSSRNFGPLATTITMLGSLGYRQAEAYGGIYDRADAMKVALERAGMDMPSGHFDLPMLEEAPEECIRLARLLGMETIICPWLDVADRPTTADGWSNFGARLQRASVPIRAAGLRFGWHNHDFEFAALPDGSMPIEHLLEGGPDLGWQMDVAWVIRGGQLPEQWIERFAGRILSAHMKDIAAPGTNLDQDGWTGIGEGSIDWKSLVPMLRRAGCEHFVIEHDNPADDRRFAEVSIASTRTYE